MSRVTRRSSAVNFQFTISETQEVSLADVRVKVQNAITRVRYNETAPFQSVGLAFASLPDLSSRENVSIHTLDYYPAANRPGVITQDYYQVDSFFTEIGKFNITDIFIKQGTGLDIPLYWEHQIPITTDLFIQSGSDILILDRNFDPVDPEEYLVWEGPTYWSVFHNFKHEYDGLTGDYTNYYISYPLWDNVRITQREHVELLDPTPRFRAAVEDDYDGTFSLPDDVPLYEVQVSGDRFLVTIYYDIVANSPMNDIYVSPTPYVYAYRPQQIHEIGALFPSALSQEDPWFPLLTNGNFFASTNEYLIAEYGQQPFIPHEPYKREIYDETIILERTLIKTQKQNLHVDAINGFHLELLIFDSDENIKYAASTDTAQEFYVDAVGEETSIPYDHEGFESVNSEDGLIQISYSLVELDDIILANYYYIETDFEYTQVNMNPIYVPDIAGKSVVLYMVPYVGQTVTMYHLTLDEEDKVEDSNGIPDSVAIPGPTNISHGTVFVGRGHTDPVDATWYIEITQSNSTPGDITDAKYRYKKGFTGAWTSETFMTTGLVTLGSGVQIRFVPGTGGQDFTAGDTWTIEVQSNDIGLTDAIIGITYDEFLDTYCLPDNVSPGFLIVARYGIGSNRGLQDLHLVDTRVRGGGINPDQLSEAKLAYPDISWMFDIGHYDGAPFPGSASTLIDLPASLLEINGGIFTREQVDSIVKHHLSFGVYPVVRFYCTNIGLVSHETVPDETYVYNWVVPEGEKCPTPDGEVICQYEFLTTTTSTTTTSSTSTTTSSTTTTVTFPPGLWVEAFDDLHWEDDAGYAGGHFTWTGTQWEQNSTPRSGRFSAIGVWYIGYRPTHIRISFTGPSKVDWVLESAGGVDTIGQATDYNSNDIVELDWSGGNDLDRLEFNWVNLDIVIPPLTIEFFEAGATTTSSTTTTSTTTSSTTSTSTTSSSTASTTTTTCPYEWETLHSNEYWEDAGEPVPLNWDAFSTRWEAGGGGNDAGLQPFGSWSVGLRPTTLRMNYGPSHEVTIKDTNGDTIGYSPLYASGDPIPLTFGSFDIGEIVLHNVDSNLVITNIELLLCNYITTTSTTTSSTSTTTSTTAPPPLFKAFHFDEFDDAAIHANWDSTTTGGNGGTVTEQNNRLETLLNVKGKNQSQVQIDQTAIKGFYSQGDFTSGFDVWGKLHIPTLSDLSKNSSGESVWMTAEMNFTGGGSNDLLQITLRWTGTQINVDYYVTDGANDLGGTIASAISQNEIWFRFYYLPKNNEIFIYYALTLPGSWTQIGISKPQPLPGAHTDLRFRLQSISNDAGRQILTWCEYVRDLMP